MKPDNETRLKEEFRYVAPGMRCRTDSFINPHFQALGHREWMEAECVHGFDWRIKTMKAMPGEGGNGELVVEQNYMPGHGAITFGAAVLKMAEYQKGQAALGLMLDPDDTGAQAGAPHFHAVAEKAGIVFNVDGDPVAPYNGVVGEPGKYPISAFQAASEAPKTAPLNSGAVHFPASPNVIVSERQRDVINTAQSLLDDSRHLATRHGTAWLLRTAEYSLTRLNYEKLTKKFDKNMSALEKLDQEGRLPQKMKGHIEVLKYRTFNMALHCAMAEKNRGDIRFWVNPERINAILHDAAARTVNAYHAIPPQLKELYQIEMGDLQGRLRAVGEFYEYPEDLKAMDRLIKDIKQHIQTLPPRPAPPAFPPDSPALRVQTPV